ncbi:hypothetical protein LSH36_576g03101 [Paralvinella palmiformis]|uniref:Coiled-coil domain-containing protein 25 n=1 Tax=Paralvinella palmiformis TaxID=53620 RepID=A0AAD9J5S1_9ANNE|nr:hypothetical protein LSH36_576g03101 [Paralvinella palmiformis]
MVVTVSVSYPYGRHNKGQGLFCIQHLRKILLLKDKSQYPYNSSWVIIDGPLTIRIIGICIGLEDDVEGHCDEILKKWQISSGGKRLNEDGCTDNNTVIDQFHSIVEKQQSQKISSRELTTEEKARKSAILAQYGHISDALSKNINALSVSERETELRERMKQEHENKKLKDKEDRERQKQKAVERKAAEKKRTQKGEHRR